MLFYKNINSSLYFVKCENLDRTIIYFITKSLSYLVVNLTFNRSCEITFDKVFYSLSYENGKYMTERRDFFFFFQL